MAFLVQHGWIRSLCVTSAYTSALLAHHLERGVALFFFPLFSLFFLFSFRPTRYSARRDKVRHAPRARRPSAHRRMYYACVCVCVCVVGQKSRSKPHNGRRRFLRKKTPFFVIIAHRAFPVRFGLSFVFFPTLPLFRSISARVSLLLQERARALPVTGRGRGKTRDHTGSGWSFCKPGGGDKKRAGR